MVIHIILNILCELLAGYELLMLRVFIGGDSNTLKVFFHLKGFQKYMFLVLMNLLLRLNSSTSIHIYEDVNNSFSLFCLKMVSRICG